MRSRTPMPYKLNTSNRGKQKEFQALFKKHGADLEISEIPLDEIDSDPLTVITHKASQLEEGIIVDDTVLDIEEVSVGIHVKWLLEHLEQYIGHKACWNVFLAYRQKGLVYIYKGEVHGMIVPSQGLEGFGFDPIFKPEGCTKTLAQSKSDEVNARALAVDALLQGKVYQTRNMITEWNGPWQG